MVKFRIEIEPDEIPVEVTVENIGSHGVYVALNGVKIALFGTKGTLQLLACRDDSPMALRLNAAGIVLTPARAKSYGSVIKVQEGF